MIYNPIKYFRLKRQADIETWLANWTSTCLKDENISFKGKVELLTGYYGHIDAIKQESEG